MLTISRRVDEYAGHLPGYGMLFILWPQRFYFCNLTSYRCPRSMELFLNLCWLSLLVPAYLLWRERLAVTARGQGKGSTAHPLVFLCTLGCAFVLLFPVISASDDLHAMRAEMEESSPGKRSVSQAAGEKGSASHNGWQTQPATVTATALHGFIPENRLEVFSFVVAVSAVPMIVHGSRGPPVSSHLV